MENKTTKIVLTAAAAAALLANCGKNPVNSTETVCENLTKQECALEVRDAMIALDGRLSIADTNDLVMDFKTNESHKLDSNFVDGFKAFRTVFSVLANYDKNVLVDSAAESRGRFEHLNIPTIIDSNSSLKSDEIARKVVDGLLGVDVRVDTMAERLKDQLKDASEYFVADTTNRTFAECNKDFKFYAVSDSSDTSLVDFGYDKAKSKEVKGTIAGSNVQGYVNMPNFVRSNMALSDDDLEAKLKEQLGVAVAPGDTSVTDTTGTDTTGTGTDTTGTGTDTTGTDTTGTNTTVTPLTQAEIDSVTAYIKNKMPQINAALTKADSTYWARFGDDAIGSLDSNVVVGTRAGAGADSSLIKHEAVYLNCGTRAGLADSLAAKAGSSKGTLYIAVEDSVRDNPGMSGDSLANKFDDLVRGN